MTNWEIFFARSPRSSGIYTLVSLCTGKKYIGSSCNINTRIRSHYRHLVAGRHHNRHMQRHVSKYGIEDIVVFVHEIVKDKAFLIEREQYWIDHIKPEFNAVLQAEKTTLGIKFEDTSKFKSAALARWKNPVALANIMRGRKEAGARKIGKKCPWVKGFKHTQESKAELSTSLAGKKKSPFHCMALSLAHLGVKMPARTAEHQEKLNAAHKGAKRSPESIAKMRASRLAYLERTKNVIS